jgi:hypothetical protein
MDVVDQPGRTVLQGIDVRAGKHVDERSGFLAGSMGWLPASSPRSGSVTNWVYRAQPVPYDWVPAGTSHEEYAVVPPDLSKFQLPARR